MRIGVIVKCDRPAAENQLGTSDQTRQQSRRTEPRRQSPLVQQLDGVVVEGEALRRRSIEEMMNMGLPPVLPRDGIHVRHGRRNKVHVHGCVSALATPVLHVLGPHESLSGDARLVTAELKAVFRSLKRR